MTPLGVFARPAWWVGGAHLARVVSVEDPFGLSRIKIALLSMDSDGAAETWARVAVSCAGDNYGAFLIPDVGEEVLVVFVGANADCPVVIGALWSGATSVPEQIGGDRIDRWTLTGRAGTRIAIVERASGEELVEIETPGGVKATLSDGGGQSIVLECGTNTLTMDTSGVAIDTAGTFSVTASTVTVEAGKVDVTAAVSGFHGVVKSDVVVTNTVISNVYQPGAGNIW